MATASGLQIVDAREEHVPLIAWVELMAGRSQVDRFFLEDYIDGDEEECLLFMERLASTEARHFLHYTNFIVAEVDGQPAAALSGYLVEAFGPPAFVAGVQEVSGRLGRTAEEQHAGWQRAAVRLNAIGLCRSEHLAGAWIVESVATRTEFRRQGLIGALLAAILDVGRSKGASIAEIGVYIDNDSAQRAYEKGGFAVVDERRHPDFESVIGCPGMQLLRRTI